MTDCWWCVWLQVDGPSCWPAALLAGAATMQPRCTQPGCVQCVQWGCLLQVMASAARHGMAPSKAIPPCGHVLQLSQVLCELSNSAGLPACRAWPSQSSRCTAFTLCDNLVNQFHENGGKLFRQITLASELTQGFVGQTQLPTADLQDGLQLSGPFMLQLPCPASL